MRIATISDIHGNLAALEAVLRDIKAEGITCMVNLGNIVSGPLYPVQTADLLMRLDMPTIRGNHEQQLLTLSVDEMNSSDAYAHTQLSETHKEWLVCLPTSLWLTSDIFLCHGTPDSNLIYLLENFTDNGIGLAPNNIINERIGACQASLILCGHTHIQHAVKLDTGQVIVDPGSVGLPAYEDDTPIFHKMESKTPHAQYAIISQTHNGW